MLISAVAAAAVVMVVVVVAVLGLDCERGEQQGHHGACCCEAKGFVKMLACWRVGDTHGLASLCGSAR